MDYWSANCPYLPFEASAVLQLSNSDMGNTCKSDFCVGNEPVFHNEAPSSTLRESTKSTREYQGRQRMGKFPDLSAEAANRLSQLVDMDFSEEKDRDTMEKEQIKDAFRLKNRWIYQGQWHKNKIWGKGRYFTPSKSYIQCYSFDGKPVGKLRIIHSNGDFYQGTTKNFKANGKGILYQNKIQYQGTFVENILEGEGREQSDDYIFQGIYEKGKKVRGKLVWNIGKQNQTMYEGKFSNQKFDGPGCLFNKVGVFKGFFKQGKKYGEGVFHWKNGARFEGEYENDMKNGSGVMYNPNGILILKTVWQNDKPLVKTSDSKIA